MRFKPPQKAKRDMNEPEIVAVFRRYGIDVEPADKPLDLVLGYMERTYLVEVKNGPKAPLTLFQQAFFARWCGHATIVCSVDDAIQLAERIRADGQADAAAVPFLGVIR